MQNDLFAPQDIIPNENFSKYGKLYRNLILISI